MASQIMLLLPLFLLLPLLTSCHAKPGFLLTSPKQLLSGSSEKMCLSLYDVEHDVVLSVKLRDGGNTIHSQVFIFQNGKGQCFDFEVPSGISHSKLDLAVRGKSESYNFTKSTRVGIKSEKTFTHIITDKPMYKPSQKVQIRIVMLDHNLRPKNTIVPIISVTDAGGSRVMQWTDKKTEKGFLSLHMSLSEEPVLGKWKIKVSYQGTELTQPFEVQEYVLPKFEVTVLAPPYVLVNDEVIEVKVCARYTYGKPVKGVMKVYSSVKQPYNGHPKRPVDVQSLDIDGCRGVKVTASSILLDSGRWSLWNARIHFSATVKEDATGVTLTGNASHTTIERDPLKIDLHSQSSEYFKPGIPYFGKGFVTKPDGTSAAGELIALSISNYKINYEDYDTNYTTNQLGEFMYKLPPIERNVVSLMIQAHVPKFNSQRNYERHNLDMPTSHISIKQWFSPSGSFIQMDPLEGSVDCGSTLPVTVTYTTPSQSDYTFTYQLITRGNIILSGVSRQQFNATEGQSRIRRDIMPMPPYYPEEPKDEPDMPILDYMNRFLLNISIEPEMSPVTRLLVFYVQDGGEVVAESINIRVNKCFRNKVSMRFSEEQVYPGEAVSVNVKADAGSTCALAVVDKSVHLLGGTNQLNIDKVFESTHELDLDENTEPLFRDDYCEKKLDGPRMDRGPPPMPGFPAPPGGRPEIDPVPMRKKRMVMDDYAYSKYFDSSHAIKVSGMVALTDQEMNTRPCTRRRWIPYMVAYDSAPQRTLGAPGPAAGIPLVAEKGSKISSDIDTATKPKKGKVVDLRNYFPETWIWTLLDIGNATEGEQSLSEKIPHSITEWVGSAMCANPSTGFGLSEPANIRAFQSFFASATLPYSVIRGEKVPVLITVFNYLSECLVVELRMKKDKNIRITSERKVQLCVCSSEVASHTFHVIPREIGLLNITIAAESVKSDKVCGNGVTMSAETGAKDMLTRSVFVEAEGREEEYSKGSYICPDNKTYNERFSLDIPENVVHDSARGYITAIGDVMGPSLSGLDSLIRLPTGCGEQNMLNFAPNIYVLQYLTESNQDAPNIRKKALEYMRTGYQRELTYRHDDGSYSAFGKSDDEGSMWLTAFVVKSFAQARSFIYIDQEDLDNSIKWFKSKQLENGCFPQVGRVLHKSIKGGLASGENPTASLTAYVLSALLSTGISKTDESVQDALQCLRSHSVSDEYTLALMAYAYAQYAPTYPELHTVLSRLDEMAIRTDSMVHWEATKKPSSSENSAFYHIPNSADVELTAYALLALTTVNSDSTAIQTGLPIVKWISSQRNAHGGFASTQDTVVALQALARYASITYESGTDLKIQVHGNEFEQKYTIDETNKFVLFSRKINVSNAITLQATGNGCAFFQVNVRYNMPLEDKTPQPAFDVRVTVPNRSVGRGAGACKKRRITVCASYLGPDTASNMAIIAVKMTSGWIPIKDSINELRNNKNLGIKRIDLDHKWVQIYLNELTSEVTCLTFEIEQDIEIDHVKPAFVHVYDYYEPELSVKTKYRVRRICGTKNELPELTQEEYDNLEQPVQARLPLEFPGLKGGSVLFAPSQDCPVCLTEVPDDFIKTFCLSRHVYKGEIRENSRYPVRIRHDLRTSPKIDIQRYINVTTNPMCTECSMFPYDGSKSSKILILSKVTSIEEQDRRHGFIHLNRDTTIIPMENVRQIHRKIRRIHKSKLCDK